MKEVVVCLKLLADLITLPLHRFGIAIVDAQNIAHPCLDFGDERVPTVQVTAEAGPETCLLGPFVQCRRHGIGVNFGYHRFAVRRTQKALIHI